MRGLLSVLILLLISLQGFASPWEIVWRGKDEAIYSICFNTPSKGWAVGGSGFDIIRRLGINLGIMLHTFDGGKSWRRIRLDVPVKGLIAVRFADPQRGWAMGYDDLIRTDNGGARWKRLGPLGYTLLDINFIDRDRGWALAIDTDLLVLPPHPRLILRTDDGGETWRTIAKDLAPWLVKIRFTDSSCGYAIGWKVLRSKDGGRRWEELRVPDGIWRGIYFLNRRIGWIVGEWGKVLHTSDGGESWKLMEIGDNPTNTRFYDVYFIDEEEGWIVGGDRADGSGVIFHTSDGGVTWEREWFEGYAIRNICRGGKYLYAAGIDVILRRPLEAKGDLSVCPQGKLPVLMGAIKRPNRSSANPPISL
jgi:photosystem II stability/assembly factor-like uncharacterized protein